MPLNQGLTSSNDLSLFLLQYFMYLSKGISI